MKPLSKCIPVLALMLASVCTVSAQPGKHDHLKKASWLIGAWEHKTPKGISAESWKKLNDSTYAGKSYVLRGQDTVSAERVSLEQRGSKLYYIPTVKNQNEGKPVTFTMTTATASELIFENPEHDFPQKITYTKINADSLVAEISGTRQGKQRAIKFPMGRVK